MTRCEDFPACGHTDGLPCNWTPPDYSKDPHALCDHEAGICEVPEPEDEDDEDLLAACASENQPPHPDGYDDDRDFAEEAFNAALGREE